MSLTYIIYIGIGGFFGAILRFVLSSGTFHLFGGYIPYGTLAVNVIGSFLIGILVLYFQQNIAPEYRAFFITGFLGSLTTFSAFSLETALMIDEQEYLKAALHTFLNVTLSVGATISAMMLFKKYYLP